MKNSVNASSVQPDRAMYGISRIDDPQHHTHAWRVSFSRRGKRFVKNFPDKKHGGKADALKCAGAYRDQFLVDHPPLSRKEFCSIIRSHNNTGINGVYRYAKPYRLKSGEILETWYWEATWPLSEGEQGRRAFSVKEFGEAVARQMAIRLREEKLKAIEGVYWASERGAVSSDRDNRKDQEHSKLARAA